MEPAWNLPYEALTVRPEGFLFGNEPMRDVCCIYVQPNNQFRRTGMAESSIEWTQHTWNPVTGCTKVSPGCKNCYAETMSRRLTAMGTPGYENGFELTVHPDRLTQPYRRRLPTVYFVNSMSDLFHEAVPDEYIEQVMQVCSDTPQHTYQVLTKRAERLRPSPRT
jgi:protein gp37